MWGRPATRSVAAMRASVISAAVALALLWAAPAAFGQAVTSVTVTTTPSPSRVGEQVALSARVTVPQAPTATPTGTVQFEVDGASFGPSTTVSNGVAAITTGSLSAGTRSIVARYHSDSAGFADSTGSASHVVNRWSSQVGLTVVPEPAVAGQSVAFTATVTGAGGGRPTGTVQFIDEGSGAIGPPVALDAQGVARISGSAGAGTYRVRADYSGDGTFSASSATVTSTIQRAATTTTLTSSANPAALGSADRVHDRRRRRAAWGVAPFGTLQMTVNGEPAGDAIPLEGYDGITLTVRAPTVATTDVIGVNYSGDENTLPSSASINQVVGRHGRSHDPAGHGGDGHAGAAQADDRAAGDQAQAARSARAQRRAADVQCSRPPGRSSRRCAPARCSPRRSARSPPPAAAR